MLTHFVSNLGAFIDGRLTIGITKFDRSYSSLSSGKKGAVTVVEAKDSIAESIRKAIDVHMVGSDNMIIPLCGEWALASSRLASCLIWDQKRETEARKKEAACALRGHPDPSLPCGQGQKPHEAVMTHPPIRIIQEIDTISGIFKLRERLVLYIAVLGVTVSLHNCSTNIEYYFINLSSIKIILVLSMFFSALGLDLRYSIMPKGLSMRIDYSLLI